MDYAEFQQTDLKRLSKCHQEALSPWLETG